MTGRRIPSVVLPGTQLVVRHALRLAAWLTRPAPADAEVAPDGGPGPWIPGDPATGAGAGYVARGRKR